MKINIFLAIIIFSTQLFINANSYYKLDHPVIQMLDGIKEAMDGAAIWDIERVRWHMRRMHVGKLDKATKKFTGIFDLNGQKYSILELAKIEAEAEQSGNQELLQKLNVIHNSAVKEFIVFTAEFLEKSKDTKHLIIKLMEESCKQRSRLNSPILSWAETNGDEETVFRQVNKNLQAISLFFVHLSDFFLDLVNSCPKGYAQFKKFLKDKKNL